MADYSYQRGLIASCIRHLRTEGRCLLAAGCGAGKTEMATGVISHFLAENPTKKVLFLSHGTRDLRSQSAGRLSSSLRVVEVTPETTAAELARADVHIALPHAHRLLREQKYGLFVQDEAHHFYRGSVTQDILDANPGIPQLLLTASHSWFTSTEWGPVVPFSQAEMLDAGTIMPPEIGMLTTDQEFRDFSMTDLELPEAAVLENIETLLGEVRPFLRGRTLIACHNQRAARDVAAQLRRMDVHAVVSTSDDDPNGHAFRRFLRADGPQVLVVVYRGVLGLNLPALETVIDLTCSQNVERISQLLGRVVRIHPGKEPRYVKLAPRIMEQWFRHVMAGVMWLALPENYASWNGRIDSIRMVVGRSAGGPRRAAAGTASARRLQDIVPLIPKWTELTDLLERAEQQPEAYACTTLLKVRQMLEGKRIHDAAAGKSAIIDFHLETRKWPNPHAADADEKLLAGRLQAYVREGSSAFCADFRDKLYQLGWQSSGKKRLRLLEEIRFWKADHGRWPRSGKHASPLERRLGRALAARCRSTSRDFDPEFAALVGAELLDPRTAQAETSRAEIRNFVVTHGRRPSSRSTNPIERRLGIRLGRYTAPSQDSYVPTFRAEIEALLRSVTNEEGRNRRRPRPSHGNRPKATPK